MRTRREQMASRRRSPSLDYLESRNLLSGGASAASAYVAPFKATETLTSRSSAPPADGVTRATTTTGKGIPLGKFTTLGSADDPYPPAALGVPFAITDGDITFTTAKGSTVTGTFTGTGVFYTASNGDEHVKFAETITITGGTVKYAGATGKIARFGDFDITATTPTGTAKDIGYISTPRLKT